MSFTWCRLTIIVALMAAGIVFSAPGFCAANKALSEGIAAFNQGKYMESLGLFNQAKSTESDNPMLHYYMASALTKLNHKEDAIREYKLTLILDPNGRLAPYCETALRALGAATEATQTTSQKAAKKPTKNVSENKTPEADFKLPTPPPQAAPAQRPKVISVLCGCPLCHRLEPILTDLNSKFGDRIEFLRTIIKKDDSESMDAVKQFDVQTCPTVILVGDRGKPGREFTGVISESELYKDVEALAKKSTLTRLSTVEDKNLAELRKMVVDEVHSRVSHDQVRVDQTIKSIQADADEQIAAINPNDRDRSSQIAAIESEAERKSKLIRADFKRRQKEWYEAAEARIQAVMSTGSYRNANPAKQAK